MKKFLTLMLTVLMALCLFGCAQDGGETSTEDTYDVVFLADIGTIYDGGFNEFSYKGIEDYAKEAGLTYTYLQPANQDDESRKTIFLQAVEQMQAKVVVAVGFLWDAALCQLVPEYPDVKVIYADADNLYNIDYDYDGTMDSLEHQDNLAMISFAEQDCGWLAGYAVVKEGFRKLGFFGGMAVPAVIRFGYGFIEGAEAAAAELGLEEGSIECNYYYTGTFAETPELTTYVANWYNSGTEIVFSCGGTIVNSVIEACEAQEGKYIVGVDSDEYYSRAIANDVEAGCYPEIITSAMKDMETSIYTLTKAAFEGGEAWKAYTDACTPDGVIVLGAAEKGCCIAPYRAENWKNFTQEDYDAANAKILEVHDSLSTDADGDNGAPLSIYKYVVVNYDAQ